jgi:hypothetical protein
MTKTLLVRQQHLFSARNSTTFAETSICTPFWP